MNETRSNSYFDIFWKLYPLNPENMKNECRALFKYIYDNDWHILVIALLKNHIYIYKYKKSKKIWTPHWCRPDKWLRQERWLDKIEIDDKNTVKNQNSFEEKFTKTDEEQLKKSRDEGDKFIREWWLLNNPDEVCPLDVINFSKKEHDALLCKMVQKIK